MIGLKYIHITPELLSQISSIDEFKGLWSGLERHTTGLSLLGDVAAYGQAFHKTLLDLKSQKIDVEMLKALHAGLARGDSPSVFRDDEYMMDIPGEEGAAGTLETAAPEDIEPLLEKLLEWVEGALQTPEKMHPVLVIAVFASVFLQIAPFKDFNIKLLRMLIIIYMLKSGYGYVPYVLLDPIMVERADEVFNALKHTQDALESGGPDWSAWLSCFIGILSAQKDILHGRLLEEKKDLSHLPSLSAKIMALFETHKRLQMKEIIKLTNGRRATIKLRLNELVESGYLKRHGQARSTWYALD